MPRTKPICPADEVVHVSNRSVARVTVFEKPDGYDAFMRVVNETWRELPIRIDAMVAMPNHWYFVVQSTRDDQVIEFFRRLTVTHTMRWHAHHKTGGTGHLYQGRFRSFPIPSDNHQLTVLRYVERNPLRANFVELAAASNWGSAAGKFTFGRGSGKNSRRDPLFPVCSAIQQVRLPRFALRCHLDFSN